MKNHFERAMESIDGAPSSGSILIGAASVPGARRLVPVGASGARHLPLHLSLSRLICLSREFELVQVTTRGCAPDKRLPDDLR